MNFVIHVLNRHGCFYVRTVKADSARAAKDAFCAANPHYDPKNVLVTTD